MAMIVNAMRVALLFMDLDMAGADTIAMSDSTVNELSELRAMLDNGALDGSQDDFEVDLLPVIAGSKKNYGGD